MMPEDRAEKIISRFAGMTFSGGLGTAWLKEKLIIEIHEARDEALEKAATLVSVASTDCDPRLLAEDIRLLKSNPIHGPGSDCKCTACGNW